MAIAFRPRWARLAVAVAAAATALIGASVARGDQFQVDSDTYSAGLQHVVAVSAGSGELVTVHAQIVVGYQGQNHVPAGSSVTFVPSAQQSTLPGGVSLVDPITVAIPADWGPGLTASGSGDVRFRAPAASGSYTVKWLPAGDYANRLTGSDPLVVQLTVNGTPPPAPSDTTPPVIVPTVTGTVGNDGWYTSDATVSWSVTDPESAIASTDGCGATAVTSDTAGTTLTCTAASAGGTASRSVTIKRDATAPVLSPAVAPAPVVLHGAAAAAPGAADVMSGVASASCAPVDTSTVGPHTVTCIASDVAGNTATASLAYPVLYSTGACLGEPGHSVLAPLSPTGVNLAKAGSTIPVKFRVCDALGVSIGDAGVVSGFSGTGPTVSTSSFSAFRWDPVAQQWIFNLSTKSMATGSYTYSIALADGSKIVFGFTLR